MNGHRVFLVPSRDLCGASPEQFGELLERLAPLAESARRERAERPGRLRAPGAGRKPYPFWLRLLVALTHLRQGTSVRATGAIFGIHERSVRRYRDEIEELLCSYGFQPPGVSRPIRTLTDLAGYVETLSDGQILVDATEVRRSSPRPWEAQKAAYSGKSRTHVVKATVVTAGDSRRPLWVEANPSGEGRTFDVVMLRQQSTLLATLAALCATGAVVVADRGYRGLWQDLGEEGTLLPVRKPSGRPYTEEQKSHNRMVNTLRMPAEHAIGRMKWWRALHYWRRSPHRFDRTAKAIGILTALT